MCIFRYTVKEPPDGAWGSDLGNGNFNGMVGMIQRGVSTQNDKIGIIKLGAGTLSR